MVHVDALLGCGKCLWIVENGLLCESWSIGTSKYRIWIWIGAVSLPGFRSQQLPLFNTKLFNISIHCSPRQSGISGRAAIFQSARWCWTTARTAHELPRKAQRVAVSLYLQHPSGLTLAQTRWEISEWGEMTCCWNSGLMKSSFEPVWYCWLRSSDCRHPWLLT